MQNKSESYWKEKLTSEQYRVLREKGTEYPFTGVLLHNKEDGMYKCAGCGAEIFSSDTKFESDSGWPSFSDISSSDKVMLQEDKSHGLDRIEVLCANCGGHLGHVFGYNHYDGTKGYYCINSCALEFEKDEK
jgi:methionine-R-sulfoxide reductase